MDAAESIVRETRPIVAAAQSRGLSARLKNDGSFVTDVDFAIEDLIRSRLGTAFPDHGIVGEERAARASDSGYEWTIDPIDGTHSLKHGVPLFGTVLALTHRGKPIVGAIGLQGMDRTYVAASGLGARCNGRPLRWTNVESDVAVEHEIIAVGERRQFLRCGQSAVFDRLMQAHPSVRTYCDCFGHALAIEGAVGAMVDYNLRIWDVAATAVLIEEVGGRYVRLNAGEHHDAGGDRYDVVFGKPAVVEWALKVIEDARTGERR
jgi:fructose-1,6-bisphosphatase/inositol monophosphatase family enzyme